MSTIDLRSDTVTLPTAEMLRAMTSAPLGDDVFGEDPTVNRLEETAADRVGKEAALFVASGTMGNLLGLLVNARPGQEVIADADSHVFRNEAAGAAMVGGIQVRQVPTERGVLSPAQLLAALRPTDDDHQPLSAAVIIENTHNWHGGAAWAEQDLRSLSGQPVLPKNLLSARGISPPASTALLTEKNARSSRPDPAIFLVCRGRILPWRLLPIVALAFERLSPTAYFAVSRHEPYGWRCSVRQHLQRRFWREARMP